MALTHFSQTVKIKTPRDFAFQWHKGPFAFERLNPPWENVEIVEREGGIDQGTVKLKTYLGPIPLYWTAKHSNFVENEQFFDKSLSGPFSVWEHTHRFEEAGSNTLLHDEIDYRIKGAPVSSMFMSGWVRRKLQRMFNYRHDVTRFEIAEHYRYREIPRKTIAITGASGLVGKALHHFLANGGHKVIPLGRVKSFEPGVAGWNTDSGEVSFGDVDQVDTFIHLAGYGIASKRWNDEVKERIRVSRSDATEKLTKSLVANHQVKESFLCASATGFYGDRGDEKLTETSPAGDGFLAEVSQLWEKSCEPMSAAGIRVANMRFGIILSMQDGALSKLLTPFKFFVGGRIGSGEQSWSWISHFDVLRAIHFILMNEQLSGPINMVSYNPVTVRRFVDTLAEVMKRPASIPFPAFAARWVLGEMADHLLLASSRVFPTKLEEAGFEMVHNTLEKAFRFELGMARKSDKK